MAPSGVLIFIHTNPEHLKCFRYPLLRPKISREGAEEDEVECSTGSETMMAGAHGQQPRQHQIEPRLDPPSVSARGSILSQIEDVRYPRTGIWFVAMHEQLHIHSRKDIYVGGLGSLTDGVQCCWSCLRGT